MLSYTLNERDYCKLLVFQDRGKPYIKRQKVLLRWVVSLILLISVPVLQIDSKLYMLAIVLLTFVWILLSGMFMDYVLMRQTRKKLRHEALPFTTMAVELSQSGLQVQQNKKEYHYPFHEITHVFRFYKVFIITVKAKQTILIPFRAFDTKEDYRYFYIQLMEGCNKNDDKKMEELS